MQLRQFTPVHVGVFMMLDVVADMEARRIENRREMVVRMAMWTRRRRLDASLVLYEHARAHAQDVRQPVPKPPQQERHLPVDPERDAPECGKDQALADGGAPTRARAGGESEPGVAR